MRHPLVTATHSLVDSYTFIGIFQQIAFMVHTNLARTLLTTRGGDSVPPKVDLLREKEINHSMNGIQKQPFFLPVFLPNLVSKSKSKV